ncbi:YhdH/YhfP family quinone oxidoreductase [Lacipirellula parvula]|uniref:Acryloyl-CoA reductase AcuI/YhdH n=1 Tax=Lacipirellula parvula TaxID=2650471 RepID=A0A5K7XRI5_9BACT|nr:YhdH/YhfP family quinone oxidoreductase [Lacipirellula parvula]BBO36569.1 acryloyl-CoA reductase AcuI/YhdH [Lacipirellula parvula]
MSSQNHFPCLMVRRNAAGAVACGVEQLTIDDLPPGDVLIQVSASSFNYKDALACRAHEGIVRSLPHVPGIDAAGRVVETTSSDFRPGDPVLVTGYDLGSAAWGGYSAFIRVPAAWVVRLPAELTAEEAMTYGTAGFTAAQCVERIVNHGITPADGEIVVTGATGGVGSLAVALLAKLGYTIAAVTGKPEQTPLLRELGATSILARDEVADATDRPLLKGRWAAAVDTVGGKVLATLLRSTAYRGCVTACGLVAGDQLPLTVYPFLLRGVTLYGIDSAKCPRTPRLEIWRRLATEWKLEHLERLRREITLSQVPAAVEEMLAGQTHGRTLVRPHV